MLVYVFQAFDNNWNHKQKPFQIPYRKGSYKVLLTDSRSDRCDVVTVYLYRDLYLLVGGFNPSEKY